MIMDDKELDETLPLTLDNLCFLPTRIYTILNRKHYTKSFKCSKGRTVIANVDSFRKFAELLKVFSSSQ
jgi:hypothetical protein